MVDSSAHYNLHQKTLPIRLSISRSHPIFEFSLALDSDERPIMQATMLSKHNRESVQIRMLPGGRWVLGLAWLTSGRYKLLCWDLHVLHNIPSAPESPESVGDPPIPTPLEPVAVYCSESFAQLSFASSWRLAPQLDVSGGAVNVAFMYAYASAENEV